jgi:hypothetical protein
MPVTVRQPVHGTCVDLSTSLEKPAARGVLYTDSMPRLSIAALAFLGACCVAGCAPEPVLSCQCRLPGWPREQLEGSFVHTIESIDVIEGTYTPPALPPPRAALALVSEDLLVWMLADGEAHLVFRIDAWLAVEPAPGRRSCCGPAWDDIQLVSAPPVWSARNRIGLDPSRELGDVMATVDPTLSFAEPTFAHDALSLDAPPPLVLDEDGRGLVLRTRYLVEPAGCADASCRATVSVTHHLRRAE